MSITVRAYESRDEADVMAIWNHVVDEADAFPQIDDLKPGEADTFFRSQSYTGVGVDDESGQIVGMYILHPNNVGRCGHLSNASYAVRSDQRGRHIGEVLVKDCLRKAKQIGYRILQFNAVVASNASAIHLYEKLGFVRLGTVPGGFLNKDGKSYSDIILFYRTL